MNYELLAHWIMCDGSRTGNGITLQVQSFSIQDVVFICNVLIIKFDITCSIHYQRQQPVIYISTKSVCKLTPHLEQFIVPSMRYKLFKS